MDTSTGNLQVKYLTKSAKRIWKLGEKTSLKQNFFKSAKLFNI